MEIPGTKRFIPKVFEWDTSLSKSNGSICIFSIARTVCTIVRVNLLNAAVI